jgi:hypothetical protein
VKAEPSFSRGLGLIASSCEPGGGLDDRRAAEEVVRLVVVDRERVVPDVVAAVPGLREERIA